LAFFVALVVEPPANKSPANQKVGEANKPNSSASLTPKRVRAHSITASDHTARFCMACICLVNLRAAFSPRFATAECGHFFACYLFAAETTGNAGVTAARA
jgi:hypothetical protein